MAQRFPSLNLVSHEVDQERNAQLRHFEDLDTKAGLILGFSGVLVAIGDATSRVAVTGKLFAVAAAAWAFATFLPRRLPALDLSILLSDYVNTEEVFTKLFLLDSRAQMWTAGQVLIRDKAMRLRIAAGFAVVAVASLGIAILRSS